ncbi:odorant receptor 49a-like [Neodiprion pinetum]|uniref:odorant receptor 49a-like n=1 Tax=Neodiprion pinetum TaxID=441929 RepID=UPI003716BCE3
MRFPPSFPRRRIIALRPTLLFLSVTGLLALPPPRHPWFYKAFYTGYFAFALPSTFVVTLLTTVEVVEHRSEVDALADRGVILAALIVILVKQNTLVLNGPRVEGWIAEIQRRRAAASSAAERTRFVRNDAEAALLIKLFFVVWILIVVAFLSPLYFGAPDADAHRLPSVGTSLLGVETDLDFALAYAWNTAALSIAILGVLGADFFMVGMYAEAARRLEALGERLRSVGRDAEGPQHPPRKLADFDSHRRFLERSVDEHSDVVSFVAELNRVYYCTLLFQSVLVAALIGGCGFYAFVVRILFDSDTSFLNGDKSSFFKSVMYISAVIGQNWLISKFGDRLKRASVNVAEDLWNSCWYELPVKDRSTVLLIMRASQKSLHMSAGTIFQMDLESLGFILSSSYSYFTVLRNMYK